VAATQIFGAPPGSVAAAEQRERWGIEHILALRARIEPLSG
jgi:hypothetical protein